MSRRTRQAALCMVLLATGALGACGLTGDLYLPEEPAPEDGQQNGPPNEPQSGPDTAPAPAPADEDTDTEADEE